MPTGTVNHHDDSLIRVAGRYLVEKDLHAIRIDVRQYQTVNLSSADINRTISIRVLMCEHGLAKRADRLWSPAPAYVRDASEARLVLKHQLDGLALRPVFADAVESFAEFFFQSCCATGSLCGWRLSGTSFLQL